MLPVDWQAVKNPTYAADMGAANRSSCFIPCKLPHTLCDGTASVQDVNLEIWAQNLGALNLYSAR